MKIIKNRLVQILAVMILLVVGIFSVNHFASPVMASDELTKGEFNAKMKEIENEFAELSDELITLKEENTQLKTNLETANNKISTLENNKDLSNLKIRVTKIETREDVLYKKFIDTTPSGSVQNIFHFMKEYKQNN